MMLPIARAPRVAACVVPCLCGLAFSADIWVEYSKDPAGNVYELNATRMRKRGALTETWIRATYKAPQRLENDPARKTFKHVAIFVSINCSNATFGVGESYYYEFPGGPIVRSTSSSTAAQSHPPPDSIGEAMIQVACVDAK